MITQQQWNELLDREWSSLPPVTGDFGKKYLAMKKKK